MKYYCIDHSSQKKILGHYPQQKDTVFHCDIDEEPRFIEHVHFQKIEFKPIIANAVLYSSSIATDLISTIGIGFSRKLLVGGKLKKLLERFRSTGLQFFRAPVLQKNQALEDFWVLNFYEVNMEFIDYPNSEIFLMKGIFEDVEQLQINSVEEFRQKKQEIESKGYPLNIRIKKYRIKDQIDQHFFTLLDVDGGVNFLVSEALKKEIEHAECTGIEFMPIEFTFKEWVYGGERDRIYGKK